MTLEVELKKKIRNTKIRRAILSAIQIAGILAVTAVAPNTLTLLGKAIDRKNTIGVKNSTRRLIEAGLIAVENSQPRRFYVTKAGEKYLTRHLGSISMRKPGRWDRKWRIVIFDIPEHRKTLRQRLRLALNAIGFHKLQQSVWVYPYDSEDLITLLKTDFKVGKEVLYIIADKVENSASLRKLFELN